MQIGTKVLVPRTGGGETPGEVIELWGDHVRRVQDHPGQRIEGGHKLKTFYQCDKCKQMFSSPYEAQECESSHYEVEMKLTPEYKYKPGGLYPTDIVLSMTDGWDVMYTYKSRVQET